MTERFLEGRCQVSGGGRLEAVHVSVDRLLGLGLDPLCRTLGLNSSGGLDGSRAGRLHDLATNKAG